MNEQLIQDLQSKRNDLDFLDKNAAAKIFILQVLYEKKEWVTLRELEFLGQMSSKTIQKYIDQITEEIQPHYPAGVIGIRQDRIKGYLLFEGRDGTVEELQQRIFLSTLAYRLMAAIFFEDFVSVVQFAQQNHVSESTINRLIRLFRERLQVVGLSIETGTLIITGNEVLIRQFILDVRWSLLQGDHWIYKHIDQEQLERAVVEISDFFSAKLSYFKRKQLLHFLAIAFDRAINGHVLFFTDTMRENLDKNPVYHEFLVFISTKLPEKLRTENEIGFLFLYLMTNDSFYQDQMIEQRIMAFHQEQQTELYQSLQLLKVQLRESFSGLQFDDSKEAGITSYLLSAHAFSQLFPGMSRASVLERGQKRNVTQKVKLRQQLRDMLKKLQQEFKGPIFENTAFLLSNYIMIFSLLDWPLLLEQEIGVLLLTDLTSLEDQKIMQQIERTFFHTFHIKVSTNKDDFMDKPHVVLASGHIPLTQRVRVPLIIFKNELRLQDFLLIEKTIRECLDEQPPS